MDTNDAQPKLSPERRAQLSRKGQILYGKFCGERGTCAEGFALHQLRLGNIVVVEDLLRFLEDQLVALGADDPDGLLPMTEALAARIREHLASAPIP